MARDGPVVCGQEEHLSGLTGHPLRQVDAYPVIAGKAEPDRP